ncbi:MAG: DUF4836 family protein [Muribaculaceae bacterium]|nr:DUF4836 family protein [Muribaculaceae bacterium]
MKKLLFPLLTALILLLPACTKDKSADAGDLLATVPSDASVVATLNLQSLLEDAGCKIEGSNITPSETISKLIEKSSKGDSSKLSIGFFKGEIGIDPTVAVLFRVGYYNYVTGIAADPSKLKTAVEKEYKVKFADRDGFSSAHNVAIKNNQFWINLDQSEIDITELKHFTALSEEQSFKSNPAFEQLAVIEDDARAWGNIDGILNTAGLSFEQRAMTQIVTQTLFDDAKSLIFATNFEKGKASIQMSVLNQKGSAAKFLLPISTVDVKTIESIGGTANGVAAIDVSHKLVDKLTKDTQSKSQSFIGLILQQLQGLDGTLALAYGNGDTLNGVVTTNGSNITDLTNMLASQGLQTTKEGNMLRISRGATAGDRKVTDLAGMLKGSLAGIVCTVNQKDIEPFDCAVTLNPDGKSVKLNVLLKTTNTNANFLETLLEMAAK